MRFFRPIMAALLLIMPFVTHAELTQRQARLLVVNCTQCHAKGNAAFPTMGNAKDWKTRNSQGEDRLLRSVIEGMAGMPPLGYCAACTEADLRALTRAVASLEEAK
jgi:cytochrome c5